MKLDVNTASNVRPFADYPAARSGMVAGWERD